jgi:hypothetical protein
MNVTLVTAAGKPAREIVNVAERHGCDLIVMGYRGVGRASAGMSLLYRPLATGRATLARCLGITALCRCVGLVRTREWNFRRPTKRLLSTPARAWFRTPPRLFVSCKNAQLFKRAQVHE